MKGLVLAGGLGTRLRPTTLVVNKHLLQIYEKPMIYYPLATLIGAGISDILVVTSPGQVDNFKELLGDGSDWGVVIDIVEQPSPNGIGGAILSCEDRIRDEGLCVILGDNIFTGHAMSIKLRQLINENGSRSYAFATSVTDSKSFGVVEYDDDTQKPIRIHEKPRHPPSDVIVTGLYLFRQGLFEILGGIRPSERGQIEITSVLNYYLKREQLSIDRLDQCGIGLDWFDAGTPLSLNDANQEVKRLADQRKYFGYPEVAAWRSGFIDAKRCHQLARTEKLKNSRYAQHLAGLVSIDGKTSDDDIGAEENEC
ncbi:MAG: NTP transferase domain-containing protein [Thermoanaerobaculia bacterium]|nr:NTP transferase domain-containing protein [Thermoanaerobaculia bacterium]